MLSKCSIRQTRSSINHQAHEKIEEVVASCHGYDKSFVDQIHGYNDSSYGRDVILHCLILFPRQPNEFLYEKVILHFHDLAIEKVGCGSLIYCIALIGGDQRVRLLDQIADVSDFLSNYVIQNLLGLKNEDATKKITSRLQKEIMGLAKRRGGCLVVEKCMEASDDGIITVAMEILDSGEQLFDLLEISLELCD
ncbi:UNVERIFIED_CONTAM: hypothetical protein Sangu_2474800 [Sesamum angustifolium]|uniref:PUM-HD domain-containing protein n=1 Tax=Sesamum angustifolium TaxID=2727405 RepID=A0AAW2IQM6_9LAMI